jgi:hypothetical protein
MHAARLLEAAVVEWRSLVLLVVINNSYDVVVVVKICSKTPMIPPGDIPIMSFSRAVVCSMLDTTSLNTVIFILSCP